VAISAFAWSAASSARSAAAPLRLTERQVASLPVAELCVPHREAA